LVKNESDHGLIKIEKDTETPFPLNDLLSFDDYLYPTMKCLVNSNVGAVVVGSLTTPINTNGFVYISIDDLNETSVCSIDLNSTKKTHLKGSQLDGLRDGSQYLKTSEASADTSAYQGESGDDMDAGHGALEKPSTRNWDRNSEKCIESLFNQEIVERYTKVSNPIKNKNTIIDNSADDRKTIYSRLIKCKIREIIGEKMMCSAKRKRVNQNTDAVHIDKIVLDNNVIGDDNLLRVSGKKRKIASSVIGKAVKRRKYLDGAIYDNHLEKKKTKLVEDKSLKIVRDLSTDQYDDTLGYDSIERENDVDQDCSEQMDSSDGAQLLVITNNNTKYICTVCHTNFNDQLSLDIHSMDAHNVKLKPRLLDQSRRLVRLGRWACLEAGCGRDFKAGDPLKQHMMEDHPNVMYTCKQCKYHTPFRRLMEK